MNNDIELSGIFSLPEIDRLIGEKVIFSSVLQNSVTNENDQELKVFSYPNQNLYGSILEIESILNKVFNNDNFSMMDSSISENNEGNLSTELHQNEGLKSHCLLEDDSIRENQSIYNCEKKFPETQAEETYDNLNENSETKGIDKINEMELFMDANGNSAESELESMDDYTTFDYGFDGSGIISSVEDWESDDNSIIFRYNDMVWPEEPLLEDEEVEVNETAKDPNDEEHLEKHMDEAKFEGESEAKGGDEECNNECEDNDQISLAENNLIKESEFVSKEIEIGKIESITINDEADNDERDIIYVKRRPGSESSYNIEGGMMHVPSVEQEIVLERVTEESVEASSSSTKFRKWLSNSSGNSKLHSYLAVFRGENFKESSATSGSSTFRNIFKGGGVFRRGGYLPSSSFNSNLVTSLGNIINQAEKTHCKTFKGENSDISQATISNGAQEARRSLRQRTLPMKISTKYQINNKTRKARENDVGSIWLIREIYLSLTPQILKLSMSMDGEWLILGSQDGIIRQWKFKEEDLRNYSMLLSSASQIEPFFNETEDLNVQAHSNAIISLHWENDERSHRFLSSSMDRTVKLWEAGFAEPNAVISCSDWPTSVSFHPIQKNIIFIGSLDASVQILRLIPSEDSSNKFLTKIVETIRVQDLLTSLSISPNGKYLACGFRDGGVAFYDARTLKYRCDVDCRNRRGKSSKGRKVSGISWKRDNKSVLVTTNDSRVRLFNLSDLSTFVKFKGHINEETLLSAQISNDEKFIVSGSENGYICLWDLQQDFGRSIFGIHHNKSNPNGSNLHSSAINNQISLRYDRINIRRGPTQHCVDSFKAFDSSLTSAILAPPSFSKKIIKFFKMNHKNSLNYPSFGTYINEKNAQIFIAVNRNGQIRFFMNIPN
ncbi:WD40 repeat-containing protein [Cryptosporidium ubiquitum]|uniref:WD40 repeat-containing protein n=1 Tax=Cryptosporidium ubiquitum TaxID=857276 RepID=A0A1J4MQB3_9CRYT|nr:WD40 repeat-containing protein [Cryptosporidium ubiquitum]OII75196.1 WD40 repeat-containing protein [Cryptosporidium ubiquitum]